jgi:hypothetical protein
MHDPTIFIDTIFPDQNEKSIPWTNICNALVVILFLIAIMCIVFTFIGWTGEIFENRNEVNSQTNTNMK